MLKKIIYTIAFCTALCAATAMQAQDYAAGKEKIYIQTNHVFFKPGETVFFKLYLVKAKDQTPSYVSNMVYAELISPAGTVVNKALYKVNNGYAEGSFDLTEQMPGGMYRIKAYTSWMLNENETHLFTKTITLQKVIAPRVLMKLDFPGKGYGPGSEVKADFSMRNLANEPIKFYTGKFDVMIGGEIISKLNFTTNNEGKAVLRFTLPASLNSNDGLVNVKVDYDAYTESISRSIPIVLNKIDLQFMPESGTLINGITSDIAFKALNENGKAADVKGLIKDSKGNVITAFESYHMGMGKFMFTPEAGVAYKAIITSPAHITQEYALPVAADNGVVMHITKANKKITITLNAVTETEAVLKVSTKSIVYHTQNIDLEKGINTVTIDENIFPEGIAVFSLYKTNETPIAERLVFLNEDKQLHVIISTDKQKYQPREKVLLTIKTTDENGKAIPSNFSLAVVDDKLWTFADDKQDHILSWLMLSSELKGTVEEPQFYFKKEESKAIPALDLLMLTQGYRYFDFIEYVQQENKLKFLPDQDNVLSGNIVNIKGQPVKAKLYLMNTVTGGRAMKVNTNADGQFFFSQLEPHQNYYLLAQSFHNKEKINISITQNGAGYNTTQHSQYKAINTPELVQALGMVKKPAAFPVLAKDDKNVAGLIAPQLNANARLDEVVVVGYSAMRKRELTGAVVNVAARDFGDVNNWANALAGKVAGIQVVNQANPGADLKLVIRGAGTLGYQPPLYVVDGIPMEQLNINTLNINDIESITVLKDASATALYGSRASSGAVVISMKKSRYDKLKFNLGAKYYYATQQVYTTGTAFTAVRKFYTPKYTSKITEERTDFRETIYWNPVVQTDNTGTASVEFYNSDAATTFRAIAEGIGYNGKLGRADTTYAVQTALQVDAKIPPYLTVGDKALLPLVIKNNSEEDMQLNIAAMFPGNFKNSVYTQAVTVKRDSALQLLIPAEATGAVKGNVQFIVSGANEKESLVLPVSAAEKGFPVVNTFSGNQNTLHKVIISKAIPGTLKTELKLFTNPEGQLLDGIESMLREPNGCFEQTSSSTYPNVFILKYLKEAGKSNPEIEKKALGYIERGYKRLIGFETAQHGFEWFGRTPAHEALTAYGLMEFTDMKEFVDVDNAMLERTKKFLLDRRDGNGTFKLELHGLDQFASVPGKIANTYIVYALTQAGVTAEIQKEYETAVQKAIESKDGYQLAMMAIAAQNMKDNSSYTQLMKVLNEQYDKAFFNAETSVVNSRESSLRVETSALYAMALMRSAAPDMGKIATLISKIMAEKSYYGYGSTQATVMALQAIVQYHKLVGKIIEGSPATFTINNKTIQNGNDIAAKLNEGNNDFAVSFKDKNKTVQYNLEVAYQTFTPPNSEKAELKIQTMIKDNTIKAGETVRFDVTVTNTKNMLQPMAIAKVGIPAGLSAQPWQLKELMEKNKVAYYEIFDNYLVFYWMGFAPNESKTVSLDLKAEIPGTYKSKASTTYLYYTPEFKHWSDGVAITVLQ
ncbi:MAG: TonB-dependent receptor plug domain-containing protein [Bacteroidetes bacterium]|nr:TonB-dependent receptor plug domain-containing protein [Bacteroidota bacterium]